MQRNRKLFSAMLPILLLMLALHACDTSQQKGQEELVVEWQKTHDIQTGNEVWQITGHDSISEAFYFYAPSFTADDRYVIFRSKRSGSWDVYRCDLTTGEIARMTEEGVDAACIHPNGQDMVYISGWQYFSMHVGTLKKELLMDFTGKLPEKPGFRPTFSENGRYTLVTSHEDTLYCLYRVDLENKHVLKVLERSEGRFSHALIHPENPELITYVPLPDTQNDMTLPMEKRPRAHIINLSEGTDKPFLIAPYGFRATHDSWSPQGDRYFFFEKTRPGWTPASIGSVDIDGNNYTRHYTDDIIMLGHGTVSQDGKWFIADSQQSFVNELLLLNLTDGKTSIVCWPNASVNTEAGVHVHPNFSLSGNYVIYTSDVNETDKPQVYIVPIREIKDSWE